MIRTRGLAKSFTRGQHTVEAVRGLDLQVERGELVALLGPNGAGKSTTLRMLTTLIAPTGGSAEVAGLDVVHHQREVRNRIGFIGQGRGTGTSQHGRDELISQARLYRIPKDVARTRAAALIESLELQEVADRQVMTLSGGQRRRLDIAMGLIHSPELLFLDEPSTGLDPHNRARLQEHVLGLRAEHDTTVVITTHYLDEADVLADRIVVIDHGVAIADGTPEALKSTYGSQRIGLTLDDAGDAQRAAAHAQRLAATADVEMTGATLRIRVSDAPSVLPCLLRTLDADGITVREATVAQPTLDDVFLTLTGRSLREGRASTTDGTTASGEDRELQEALP